MRQFLTIAIVLTLTTCSWAQTLTQTGTYAVEGTNVGTLTHTGTVGAANLAVAGGAQSLVEPRLRLGRATQGQGGGILQGGRTGGINTDTSFRQVASVGTPLLTDGTALAQQQKATAGVSVGQTQAQVANGTQVLRKNGAGSGTVVAAQAVGGAQGQSYVDGSHNASQGAGVLIIQGGGAAGRARSQGVVSQIASATTSQTQSAR